MQFDEQRKIHILITAGMVVLAAMLICGLFDVIEAYSP